MDIGSLNGQKGVAIVDREVIGRQVVPNMARAVARVIVARDRARKASPAKAKMMMAKEKAKVASGKHAKHLMGTASLLMNLRKMDQRTLQLADSVCAHFETIAMTGSGTVVAK